jgi:hypothetical protein
MVEIGDSPTKYRCTKRGKPSPSLLALLPHEEAANKENEHDDDKHYESIHSYSFRPDPSRNESVDHSTPQGRRPMDIFSLNKAAGDITGSDVKQQLGPTDLWEPTSALYLFLTRSTVKYLRQDMNVSAYEAIHEGYER